MTDAKTEGGRVYVSVTAAKESENVRRTLEVAQAEVSGPISLRVAWESLPKTTGTDTGLVTQGASDGGCL